MCSSRALANHPGPRNWVLSALYAKCPHCVSRVQQDTHTAPDSSIYDDIESQVSYGMVPVYDKRHDVYPLRNHALEIGRFQAVKVSFVAWIRTVIDRCLYYTCILYRCLQVWFLQVHAAADMLSTLSWSLLRRKAWQRRRRQRPPLTWWCVPPLASRLYRVLDIAYSI